MLKKIFQLIPLVALALVFSFSARAQQSDAVTEDVAYELPAMVSEKTVPIFDSEFAAMPGVKVSAYCFNMSLVVFSVDRNVQKDNAAIEEKIHSIFKTNDQMMHLQSKAAFNKNGFLIMCNETELITR